MWCYSWSKFRYKYGRHSQRSDTLQCEFGELASFAQLTLNAKRIPNKSDFVQFEIVENVDYVESKCSSFDSIIQWFRMFVEYISLNGRNKTHFRYSDHADTRTARLYCIVCTDQCAADRILWIVRTRIWWTRLRWPLQLLQHVSVQLLWQLWHGLGPRLWLGPLSDRN